MADSVQIKRANVLLDIPNDEAVISKYLSMGYDLLDDAGKVAKKATSGKSAGELQREIDELTAENKKLRIQIKRLKEAKAEEAKVEEAKPKRSKKAE